MKASHAIQITGSLAIDEREIEERFVRASGPGGQNVNKVATAVELRMDLSASSLPADVKARLTTLAGRKVSTNGVLTIDSREFRTQARNREAARERLVALIRRATVKPRRRTPTRPRPASKEERLTAKKLRGRTKALRGRNPAADD